MVLNLKIRKFSLNGFFVKSQLKKICLMKIGKKTPSQYYRFGLEEKKKRTKTFNLNDKSNQHGIIGRMISFFE